ncbi:MAG: helix-turn-helix transcriptional regulator [Thermoanaerobacteraceae bacterium]|nr:helix-turn-helix transcriptional regulator [Thermoanaerobacteraceae bacterium]
MIRCRLAEIMAEKRERNLSELSRRTGVSRATLIALYKDTIKYFPREALDAICREYKISVGELLVVSFDES